MQEYVTELSRYGIAACGVCYVLAGLIALFREKMGGIYVLQNLLLFLMQLLFFGNLLLVSGNLQYVLYYVFVQIFLLVAVLVVPMIYEHVDRLLLQHMCMLIGCGFCILSRLFFEKAVRQYLYVLVTLSISLVIPYLLNRFRFWKKLTWIYGAVGILLLGTVLVAGEQTYGSRLSFSIGDITFQPSEFVKILFVLFVAGALWEKRTFHRVALTGVVAGIHVGILVLSKDLGSALVFFVGYVFLVFVATGNPLYLLAGAAGGSVASYGAFRVFGHVQSRVLAWMDPWTYIDGKGYALTQSLFAIGSGSWFGMGLMQGNPTAIPFVESDFIFSALCEELGVLFGICMLLVMLVSFLDMMKMAAKIRDRFYQLVVYGFGILYIFQIFLTVGGGIRLIPLTGVTLPFVSYGGSSVMATMFMFFFVQGIYIRLQQEGGRYAEKRKRTFAGDSAGRKGPGYGQPGQKEPGKGGSDPKEARPGEPGQKEPGEKRPGPKEARPGEPGQKEPGDRNQSQRG